MRENTIALASALVLVTGASTASGQGSSRMQRLAEEVRPVTDDVLENPDPADWVTARGTLEAWGYSQLGGVYQDNVHELEVLWSESYGRRHEGRPLVRDGVMYLPTGGNGITGIDGFTGDVLWETPLTAERGPSLGGGPRATALFNEFIIEQTSDGYVLAHDSRNGENVWEAPLGGGLDSSAAEPVSLTVADGMVIATSTCVDGPARQSCGVTAYDASTGEFVWAFRLPESMIEFGVETWANSPTLATGGTTWQEPAYDPGRGLLYFGIRPPAVAGTPAIDGTATDGVPGTAVALDAATGGLAWYNNEVGRTDSHEPFGPVVVLPASRGEGGAAAGDERSTFTVVADTSGATYWLDATTGVQFESTESTEPLRGFGTPNGAAMSGLDVPCSRGARGAEAGTAAYSPRTHSLYMVYAGCAVRGDTGAPAFGSVLQAVSLDTGQVAWRYEQDAAMVAPLVTAGGLVFSGDADGNVRAFHDATGAILWERNVGAPVEVAAITYAAEGQQLIAISTGGLDRTELAAIEEEEMDDALVVFAIANRDVAVEQTPPGAREEAPVYNAVFAPRGSATNILFGGEETTVRFYIGPADADSGIEMNAWTVNPEILAGDFVPLSITMTCQVCATGAVQMKPITYNSEYGRSSEATFRFIPDVRRTDTEGRGHITFDVWGVGHYYNRIAVEVVVVQRERGTLQSQPQESLGTLRIPPRDESVFDLKVLVGLEGGAITYRFVPNVTADGALVRLSDFDLSAFYENDGDFRTFRGRPVGSGDLQRIVAGAYAELKAATDAYDELGDAPEPTRAGVLEAFRRTGNTLYDSLLGDGAERELQEIFEALELAGLREPLRIVFEQRQDVHVPWQLMHPALPTHADRSFWAEHFEIGVMPDLGAEATTLEGVLEIAELGAAQDPVVFLRYDAQVNDEVETDDTVDELGQVLARWLRSIVGADTHFREVTEREEFFADLKDVRKRIPLIVAFAHGVGTVGYSWRSGIAPGSQVGRRLVIESYPASRLVLGADGDEGRIIEPTHLSRFRQRFGEGRPTTGRGAVLERQPIVVLNACETAPVGTGSMGTLDFAPQLLRLGARGVIATEAPVEAKSALRFGKRVLEGMIEDGDDVLSALFAARSEFLARGNPVGLAYSFFGNPGAELRRKPR